MALNLLDPAQESLKSSAGNGPKSALASAEFGTFSALETARICAAGLFNTHHLPSQSIDWLAKDTSITLALATPLPMKVDSFLRLKITRPSSSIVSSNSSPPRFVRELPHSWCHALKSLAITTCRCERASTYNTSRKTWNSALVSDGGA